MRYLIILFLVGCANPIESFRECEQYEKDTLLIKGDGVEIYKIKSGEVCEYTIPEFVDTDGWVD